MKLASTLGFIGYRNGGVGLSLKPESVCLVPENRKEVTTEEDLTLSEYGTISYAGELSPMLAFPQVCY